MPHNRPLKTTAALTAAVALAAATAASAKPIDSRTPAPAPIPTSAAPLIVHLPAPGGGFDWGDAGIGAAGGVALSILGLGSALALSGRRSSRQAMRRA